MSFFDRIETRWGHWGIPGLVQGLAIFHVLTFLLVKLRPEFGNMLTLSLPHIMKGEVWRVLSFVLLPPTDSPLWMFFAVMFMMFVGRVMEAFWSPFRILCYVFLSAVIVPGACLISQWQMGFSTAESVGENLAFMNGIAALHSMLAVRAFDVSIFIAMATLAPRQEIQLMFVFPVQLRWMAIATVVITLFFTLTRLVIAWPMLAGFVPWLLFFGRDVFRGWRSQTVQTLRRRAFVAKTSQPESEAFHTCAQCARNSLTHPELEFRLLADDTEMCVECLKKSTAAGTPSPS